MLFIVIPWYKNKLFHGIKPPLFPPSKVAITVIYSPWIKVFYAGVVFLALWYLFTRHKVSVLFFQDRGLKIIGHNRLYGLGFVFRIIGNNKLILTVKYLINPIFSLSIIVYQRLQHKNS
jgi:hypothetical protein